MMDGIEVWSYSASPVFLHYFLDELLPHIFAQFAVFRCLGLTPCPCP